MSQLDPVTVDALLLIVGVFLIVLVVTLWAGYLDKTATKLPWWMR